MRLASSGVKRLLAHGQRMSAAVADIVFSGRIQIRDALQTPDANASCRGSRVALAVPKRQLKRAVDRNRVKRVLRETFRQHPIREVGIDMLVTLNAVPKVMTTGTQSKRVRKNIQLAATALFTKLTSRLGAR